MMHFMTITYQSNPNKEDKEYIMKYFTEDISKILPCSKCRKHYVEIIDNYKLTEEIVSNKLKLILWLIDIHNIVNINTGKQILNIEEAIVGIFNLDIYDCRMSDIETYNYDLNKIYSELFDNNYEIEIDSDIETDVTVYSDNYLENNKNYENVNKYIIEKNKEMENKEIKKVEKVKCRKIDFKKIINMFNKLISESKNIKNKKMLVSAFETVCLLFI